MKKFLIALGITLSVLTVAGSMAGLKAREDVAPVNVVKLPFQVGVGMTLADLAKHPEVQLLACGKSPLPSKPLAEGEVAVEICGGRVTGVFTGLKGGGTSIISASSAGGSPVQSHVLIYAPQEYIGKTSREASDMASNSPVPVFQSFCGELGGPFTEDMNDPNAWWLYSCNGVVLRVTTPDGDFYNTTGRSV